MWSGRERAALGPFVRFELNTAVNARHEAAGAMGILSWAFTPDEALNYGFISIVYAILSAISGGLFAAQYVFDVDHLTGWWIVPSPCVLALAYVLILRSIQAQRRAAPAAVKKSQ